MPTRPQSPGFTLLELLVVMFIVGIIAAMATLSVGVATSEKSTEKEIDRIEDLLKLASEEAVLQGRELGLTFYSREYEFSSYDAADGLWTPLTDDSAGPFSSHRLPPESVVDLEIEDRLVALAEEKRDRSKDKAAQPDGSDPKLRRDMNGEKARDTPQVFILSSGDITPFAVRLRPSAGNPGITLKVAGNGAVETVRDER